MTQGPCVVLHCVEHAELENIQIFTIIHDKMQERNAKERKDRIWVYPFIALCCDERQNEGDAMQRKPLHHIIQSGLTCKVRPA